MKAIPTPVRKHSRKGQSLVEAIAAIAMVALVATALVGLSVGALRTSTISRNRSRAVSYAQEGMEAIRSIRDRNYNELPTGTGSYKLFWAGDHWEAQLGTEILGGFNRSFTVSQVGTGKLWIKLSVQWKDSLGDQSVVLNSYLTDWR